MIDPVRREPPDPAVASDADPRVGHPRVEQMRDEQGDTPLELSVKVLRALRDLGGLDANKTLT
jgi:hypothetical protein